MNRLIIGIGFRSEARASSIEAAIIAALASAPRGKVTALATADDKAQHPAILAAAGRHNLPVIAVDAARLRNADPHVTTRSPISLAQRGVGSVCEAAALAAAGDDATLIVARVVSTDHQATAAIASSKEAA